MAQLAAETRAAIVADLRAGKSQNATARLHGVSQPTVFKIARAEGIAAINAAPKNAAPARTIYSLEARLALSDEAFAVLAEDLRKRQTPLKDWAVAYAILTDKRRLEEGQATERHEFTDSDRGLVFGRVDELAARRRARLAAETDAGARPAAGS